MFFPTCQDGTPLNPKQLQFVGFHDDGTAVAVVADYGRTSQRIWNFTYADDETRIAASQLAVDTVLNLNEILGRTPRYISWDQYVRVSAADGIEVAPPR